MLDFSAHALPYASQRSPVHARRGMVATSQPQAAQVGWRYCAVAATPSTRRSPPPPR